MFVFNLPQSIKPMSTYRGVDKDKTRVMPPPPMFVQQPFENYTNIPHSDASVMGWNQAGNFSATSMAKESTMKTFRDMANNNSIIGIINDRRRRNF